MRARTVSIIAATRPRRSCGRPAPARAGWPGPRRGALALAAALTAVAVPAPAPAESAALRSWSAGPGLAAGREFHTATLVGARRVLVAGGLRPSGPTTSSEIFDDASRRWVRASPLTTPRLAHAAAQLRGGRVLVSGGGTFSAATRAGYLSSAEIYDPLANRWTATTRMSTPRANHTATSLADGRVLVVGGLNSFGHGLAAAEIYNPAANTWSPAGTMQEARFHHTATLMPNGKVLVTGGHQLTGDGSTVALSSAELYDPATNAWSAAPRMSAPRDNHSATLMANGRVLVAGGGSRTAGFLSGTQVYDPTANRWSPAGRLREPRGFHATTLLPNGGVVAVGGLNDCGALSSVELFSPRTGRWTTAPSLRTPRGNLTATALVNNQVVVAGGATYAGLILRSTELLLPGTSDRTGPQACGLRVSPQRLRAARSGGSIARRGATVRYTLSESGVVRFTVRRTKAGRLRGRRCAPSRGAVPRRLRCTRFVRVRGSFSRRSRSGRNRFRFSGRVGGRALSPGAYQLAARPRDRRRNAGVSVDVAFRIVR